MNNREKGRRYEDAACLWLSRHGHEILERNFYAPGGEIDIISSCGGCIFFSEVKYRKDLSAGSAEDSVGQLKKHRIRRAAAFYLMEHSKYTDLECEFLVIAVNGERLRIYRNAF